MKIFVRGSTQEGLDLTRCIKNEWKKSLESMKPKKKKSD